MKTHCQVADCHNLTSTYGIYCPTHKSNDRRHGAPTQRGITKGDLKPYRTVIERRIASNSALKIWDLTDQRWLALVEHARQVRQTTFLAPARDAAGEIIKLAENVTPREIVVTVLAMYLLQEEAPHLLKSGRAFRTQLVRRVRALTTLNAKEWPNNASGRTARVYTDLSPRVIQAMGDWIVGVLGPAGAWVAQKEARAKQRKAEEASQFKQALEEIDFS